jgi:hypothetical protein
MTSKPQSTTTAKPQPTLAESVSAALTSHEYDDVVGPVAVNVVDALMAIATAIHRLALSQEALLTTQERLAATQERAVAAQEQAMAISADRMAAMMHVLHGRLSEPEGHA